MAITSKATVRFNAPAADFVLEEEAGVTSVTRTVTIPRGKGLKGLLAKYVAPSAVAKEAVKGLQTLKTQLSA